MATVSLACPIKPTCGFEEVVRRVIAMARREKTIPRMAMPETPNHRSSSTTTIVVAAGALLLVFVTTLPNGV